jgi:hypothetical protein
LHVLFDLKNLLPDVADSTFFERGQRWQRSFSRSCESEWRQLINPAQSSHALRQDMTAGLETLRVLASASHALKDDFDQLVELGRADRDERSLNYFDDRLDPKNRAKRG